MQGSPHWRSGDRAQRRSQKQPSSFPADQGAEWAGEAPSAGRQARLLRERQAYLRQVQRRRQRRRYGLILALCLLCLCCAAYLLREPIQRRLFRTFPSPQDSSLPGLQELVPKTPDQTQDLSQRAPDFSTEQRQVLDQIAARSVAIYDLGEQRLLYLRGEQEAIIPASCEKLFCIAYALSYLSPDEVYSYEAAVDELIKPESSLAWLQVGERYSVRNLIEGMLVPSGNDAAYALAVIGGRRLAGAELPVTEAIQCFLQGLSDYLQSSGYRDTHISDPSGYSYEDGSSARDLLAVTQHLLQYDWIREAVASPLYKAQLPAAYSVEWKNSNRFLHPDDPFYNPHVQGIKTGSLENSYNLVSLYQNARQRSFIVLGLAYHSTEERDQGMKTIFDLLETYGQDGGNLAAEP